jgi:pimeloyl-ACP methyl ester carboxylesterase
MKPNAIAKGLNWAATGLYRSAGYRWEVRRNGELKLGVWRKQLHAANGASSAVARKQVLPKRFVFVPGFGDSSISWFAVLSLLTPVLRKAGFDEVALVDFPGYNSFLSEEKSFHSMDLLNAAVGDLFDWLAPQTLMGHSLGGWLIGRYAIECGKGARPALSRKHGYSGPERIVLVAPAGVFSQDQHQRDFQSVFSRLAGGEGFAALRKHLFAKEPFWFKYGVDTFGRFATQEDVHQFTQSVRDDHFLGPGLGEVKAQTWLIWGEKDSLCLADCLPTWQEGLKNTKSTGVVLPDIGHNPQLERPAVLATILARILLDRPVRVRGTRWWKVIESAA